MKKAFLSVLMIVALASPTFAQYVQEVKPVKNVIVMIPDGCSLATVSLARWLQWYQDPNAPKLNIDPYLCGTVRTHSSNAPIGDSAPTTSCYMSGFPSRTGSVSSYPLSDPGNDIYPTDSTRAYAPVTTVLEAAKQLKGKATGLVFTCEFPHATPADCSAHSYNRGRYDWIAPQMAHNDINVVIGGGTSLLPAESEEYLKANGTTVLKDDIQGMRNYNGKKLWSLFAPRDMDYDFDRDPAKQPSLEEMTKKAISILSQDPNGFFMMVEGSKVDWAAHANDPVGMVGDFLAFDKACGAALDFAVKNGETAVIILPDHGNSGISIGKRECPGYDKLTKDQLFNQLSQYKATANKLASLVNEVPNSEVQNIFQKYAGIELTSEELNALNNCKDYKNSPIPADQRSSKNVEASLYSGSLTSFMSKLLTSRTCIGFTTGGHTGEEVFLACYHPQGTRATGMLTNIEINEYLCNLFGMTHQTLEEQNAKNFARHQDVFADYQCIITPSKDEKGSPTLTVKSKKGKKQLNITPFSNVVTYGKKGENTIQLNSVIVYVDKTNTFYVPTKLVEYLQ